MPLVQVRISNCKITNNKISHCFIKENCTARRRQSRLITHERILIAPTIATRGFLKYSNWSDLWLSQRRKNTSFLFIFSDLSEVFCIDRVKNSELWRFYKKFYYTFSVGNLPDRDFWKRERGAQRAQTYAYIIMKLLCPFFIHFRKENMKTCI